MKYYIVALTALALLLMKPVTASAQVYFDLAQEAIARKANQAGFDFERRLGAEPDSAKLIFKKREEDNFLICYLNGYGICYKFAYRLPARLAPDIVTNLNKHLTRTESGKWQSREKSFLVELIGEADAAVVVYTPSAKEQ